MNITIGKRPHVGHRLPSFDLLPECVSEDVILAEDGHDLVVLDDLEGPGHDEAEVVNALAGVVQQVARGAVTVHNDIKVFGCESSPISRNVRSWVSGLVG